MNDPFNQRLLSRATMSEPDAAAFREQAQQRVLLDEETGARVVCYVHPDGRILMDAIRLLGPTT